jgi:hypothetical protein
MKNTKSTTEKTLAKAAAMKPKDVASAVEKIMAKTNLTASAAFAEVKKQADADAKKKTKGASDEIKHAATFAKVVAADAAITKQKKAAKDAKKAKPAKAEKTALPKAVLNRLRADSDAADAKKAKPAKAAKPAKKAKATKTEAGIPRAFSKSAIVLDLITRKGGATAQELQDATGWQPHSVRGFLSTASKKGLASVTSTKREDGQRVYSA